MVMKMRKIISLLLVSVVAATVLAGDRDEIRGLYSKLQTAIKNKDLKTIRWAATKDMKWKDTSGQVRSIDQVLEQIKQQFAMTKKVTGCNFMADSVKLMGDKAVAMASFKIMADVIGQDKKSHKLVNWGKSKDSFRRTKDGWRCYMVERLSDKTTLDGKPWPPAQAK
jgi:ketosteroid isomerase-like protein